MNLEGVRRLWVSINFVPGFRFLIFSCVWFSVTLLIWAPNGLGKGGGARSGRDSSQGTKRTEKQATGSTLGFITRNEFVIAYGIDAQYRTLSNPLLAEPRIVESGRKLYMSRCSECHGVSGNGRGKQSEYIDPFPTDLTTDYTLPVSQDAYIYWTLAQGGARFNTQMPRFKDSVGMQKLTYPLQESEIWQLAHYLKTLNSASEKEK